MLLRGRISLEDGVERIEADLCTFFFLLSLFKYQDYDLSFPLISLFNFPDKNRMRLSLKHIWWDKKSVVHPKLGSVINIVYFQHCTTWLSPKSAICKENNHL